MTRHTLILATAFTFLISTGCVPKNWIAWAPNGQTAALITDDGLQLMSPTGQLSQILIPNATTATWSPNGKQLLVSQTQEVIWFKDIQSSVSDPQFTALLNTGKIIHHLTNSPDLDSPYLLLTQIIEEFKLTDNARAALALYLQDEFDQEIPSGLIKQNVAIPTAKLLHYKLYDYIEGQLTPSTTRPSVASTLLNTDTHQPPRFSPDGKSIAYLAPADGTASNALWITNIHDNSAIESLIVPKAVAFDWTPDSKSLAYMEPLDTNPAFVALRAKQVRDANGDVPNNPQVTEIAGLLTANAQFLRVLPDGQIVFLATPLNLPLPSNDFKPTHQFYQADPKEADLITQITGHPGQNSPQLTRITDASLSPDSARIAYVDNEGRAGIIQIKNGKHTPLQTEKLQGVSTALVPAWRNRHQLTFVQRHPKRGLDRPDGRVVLWSKGEIQSVLSDTWDRDTFASRLGRQTTAKK